MAVYVIAIAAVVVLLIAAYRTLGGASLRPVDPDAVLHSLHTELCGVLGELSAAIATPGALHDEDTARTGRRRTAAIQQRLDGLPPDAGIDNAQAAVRALLAAASEDAAWGWRMFQAGPPGPGPVAAMLALCDHATRCCAEAAPLVSASASGKPSDGAGDSLLEPGPRPPVEQLGSPADVEA